MYLKLTVSNASSTQSLSHHWCFKVNESLLREENGSKRKGKLQGVGAWPCWVPLMPVTFLHRSTLIHSLVSPQENKMHRNTSLESSEEHRVFLWLCWLQLPHTYNNKFLVSLAHMFEQCVAASLTVGDISFAVSRIRTEAVCPMKKLTSWVPAFAISHHLQLYPPKILTKHLLGAQPPSTQRYPKQPPLSQRHETYTKIMILPTAIED